ncbi:MAG TPA: tetratricopeptide repeat protein [Anaeromyxobacteraceae bacterium]|nr:tetratricopeptide repeat protein [Anaeromyxobacteraceae bacterium]
MARAAGPEEEVEGLDEEFLYHLSRGSDLLARGDGQAALTSLSRAAQLRPRDSQALGLLGQAEYRLGRFEEAIETYGRLVDENPVEAAARVNLGLACLKAGRHAEAVKQLSIALDLNPDHKKAQGYLGLAYLDSGNPRGAREWFARAGSNMMVARCDEIIAAGGGAPALARDASPPESPEAFPSTASPEPVHSPASAASSRSDSARGAPRPPPAGPAQAPALRPVPAQAAGTRPAAPAYQGLAGFAAGRVVTPPGEVFATDGQTLTMWVHGEILTRLEGLFAVRGKVDASPAWKRFRGRATERPFGEGPSRMHRVKGEGALFFRAAGRRHLALDLGGDAGYFREEAVFAMEESVAYENGRVPSKLSGDLNLVHLRGKGRFLLATAAEPVAVEVSEAAPLRVPLEGLVGWVGALTPKVVSFAEAPPSADGVEAAPAGPAMVELTGEGRALVDPAAAVPAGTAQGA